MSWHHSAERGSAWGLDFMAWTLRRLGMWPTRVVTEFVVVYFYLTGRRARLASCAYLRRVHAAKAEVRHLRNRRLFWASYQHFRTFGIVSLDRLALWTDRSSTFTIDFPNRQLLQDLHDRGQGAVLLGAHIGSFEAMRVLSERSGKAVYLLMFQGASPRLYQLLARLAPAVQQRVVHLSPDDPSTVLELQRRVEAGHWIAILGDRKELTSAKRVVRTQLLGAPIELPSGPFFLAALLRCPVYTTFCVRTGNRRYELWVEKLAEKIELRRAHREDDVRPYVDRYAAAMEKICLRAPLQWFNFYDAWTSTPEGSGSPRAAEIELAHDDRL